MHPWSLRFQVGSNCALLNIVFETQSQSLKCHFVLVVIFPNGQNSKFNEINLDTPLSACTRLIRLCQSSLTQKPNHFGTARPHVGVFRWNLTALAKKLPKTGKILFFDCIIMSIVTFRGRNSHSFFCLLFTQEYHLRLNGFVFRFDKVNILKLRLQMKSMAHLFTDVIRGRTGQGVTPFFFNLGACQLN